MAIQRLRLGQLLVDAKLVAQADLDATLDAQKNDGRRLGTLLVERGLINETQLTQILSHQLAVPWVSLLHIEFSRQLLNLVPHEVAEKFCLVPIYVRHVRNQGETLYVAMDDPTNEEGLSACQAHAGLPVRAMIAPPQDIRSAIRVYYGGAASMPPTANVKGAEKKAARAKAVAAPVEKAPEPPAPPPIADNDGPEIEAHEVTLPKRPSLDSEPPASDIPRPRGKTPRMIALTLLDGTTINLPSQKPTAKAEPQDSAAVAAEESGLTARDLVSALRAVAAGADAGELLGSDARWETLFAALLSLLLKKHLIADWEFVDELKRARVKR